MSQKIILLISVTYISSSTSSYFNGAESSNDENNQILSRGIWINSNKDEAYEKNTGDFIFRPNSLDVDNELQNEFDAFGESFMQGSPVLPNYVERNKRSNDYDRKRVLKCNGDKNCLTKKLDNKSIYVKSKMMSKLRPASLFNDYPYEVAIMLRDNKETPNHIRKVKESGDLPELVIPIPEKKERQAKLNPIINTEPTIDNVIKYNNSEVATPKRSMKNDYETEVIKKLEYTEEIEKNNENSSSKLNRNVFDKEERVWYENPTEFTNPNKNNDDNRINHYNVEPHRILSFKPVNERGLIKVISMLTRTFKKIIKQHSDIRKIHTKLNNLNVEVTKNIEGITKKFADFEEKYLKIVDLSNKIKLFESKMDMKENYYKTKNSEMSKNLEEFESQQKKFLQQQRQFYNIQKLMLAQNEKINLKQNLIAKTQSEISHRQYNFARILKKAKQIYIDSKNANTKLYTTTNKPQSGIETGKLTNITHTTTQEPVVTDTIKINLFSIPALDKLVDQDTQILKEKDQQPVDDLVYKYYFNNTFIDNLMKNKVLSHFVITGENTEIARNAKNKRDEDIIENTILLPVQRMRSNREKRWIRHAQSKSKLKRRFRGKKHVDSPDTKDDKLIRNNANNVITSQQANNLFSVKDANDPFLVMAKSFCNEIGQNSNDQILHWCIEKALRRLQYLDMKLPFTMPIPSNSQPNTVATPVASEDLNKTTSSNNTQTATDNVNLNKTKTLNEVTPSTMPSVLLFTPSSLPTQSTSEPTTNIYFPDNDELELNLKQYELTPDTEGTVYYDGSIHTSDLVIDNDGYPDFMPDLDSNSRVALDPLTLDLQAMRRDPLRRLQELKRIAYG